MFFIKSTPPSRLAPKVTEGENKAKLAWDIFPLAQCKHAQLASRVKTCRGTDRCRRCDRVKTCRGTDWNKKALEKKLILCYN